MMTQLRDWLSTGWRQRYEAEHEYAQRIEGIQRDTYTNYLNTMGELHEAQRQLQATRDELAAYQRAAQDGVSIDEARAAIEAEKPKPMSASLMPDDEWPAR